MSVFQVFFTFFTFFSFSNLKCQHVFSSCFFSLISNSVQTSGDIKTLLLSSSLSLWKLNILIMEDDPLLPKKIFRVCGIRRSTFLLTLFTLWYVVYLLIGASVFMYLEKPMEVDVSTRLREVRRSFLEAHSSVTDEALEEFIVEIIQANNVGVSAVRNVTMEPNWSFGQSFFFATTVITTIGYGHVTPLSEGGKIFCIIYSLFGIPLNMILLMAFVQRLMIPITLFLQFLNSRLGHLYQPFNIRMFHLSIIVVVIFLLFYLIPASVFMTLEPNWNFLDSLYYCFISLTTIGLGDYIPGDNPDQPYRPIYKVACSVYLLIGLTFMMLIMTMFCDIPQLNFGVFFLVKSDEQIDPEKLRLHSGGLSGPKYTPQIDDNIRESIRVKPRSGGDTSSPEETR